MNKRDLVRAVAKATGKPIVDVDVIVEATFQTLTSALDAGETVSLGGFGSFSLGGRAKTKKTTS